MKIRRADPVGEFPKGDINKIVILHSFAQKRPWTDFHQILHSRSRRRNQCTHAKFFWRSVKGVVENRPVLLTKPVAVNSLWPTGRTNTELDSRAVRAG